MVNERDPSYFNTFSDSLNINSTTLKLTTYLEMARGNTKYNHQDGGILHIGIGFALLDRGSMVDNRDPSFLKNSWTVCP
jgi:hypothetical protein